MGNTIKVVFMSGTIKNGHIQEIIDYILFFEKDSYIDYVYDLGWSYSMFKENWRNVGHIYTSAILAAGEEPDFCDFENLD